MVALACDFIQYVIKALMLGGANTYFWWVKGKDEEQDVKYSEWLNLGPYLFLVAKAACLVIGYWKMFWVIYALLK